MKYKILQLDEKNMDDFWRLRKELFLELGEISKEKDISELKAATKQYYLSHINKDLSCWGVYQENLSGTEGYILNIYTSEHFRKFGFANQILDKIIEYSQQHQINRLWLSSSEQGKRIYTRKGFIKRENEMELYL
ncbi:GNAT family N-acetyltransferase [Lactococcus garvieae]|uniref:GNAT family N-acetyltransferase n=1 Tax=Lactococcus garvieae TaxID=1363 RepID=UPI00398E5F0C